MHFEDTFCVISAVFCGAPWKISKYGKIWKTPKNWIITMWLTPWLDHFIDTKKPPTFGGSYNNKSEKSVLSANNSLKIVNMVDAENIKTR